MGDKIRPAQMEVTTGAANNDTVPTLGKVEEMIGVENLWDKAGTVLAPHTAGDSVKANKIQGQTSTTSIDIDKLTINTTATGFTTISSSDATNVLTLAGGASSAIFRVDRGTTTQNANIEFYTATALKWQAGLIANEGDDFLITGGGTTGEIKLITGSSGKIILDPGSLGVLVDNVAVIGNDLTMGGSATIKTDSGDLVLDSVNLRFDTATSTKVNTGTFALPTGTTVNEISTTVDGSSTDDQIPTALAVWNAVVVENIWDRVTGSPNYVKPYNDGDSVYAYYDAGGWFSIDPTATRIDLKVGSDITELHINSDTVDTDVNIWGTGSGSPVFFLDADANAIAINTTILSGFDVTVSGSIYSGGDIGATSSRISKGWFTNLEITNYPSVNGTALSDQYLATTNSPSFVGEALSGILTVDTINEYTGAAGVTIDSVLCKDGALVLPMNTNIGAIVIEARPDGHQNGLIMHKASSTKNSLLAWYDDTLANYTWYIGEWGSHDLRIMDRVGSNDAIIVKSNTAEVLLPLVYGDTVSTSPEVLHIQSDGQLGKSTTATPTFAQLTVDNIRINGNTISTTNVDGSLTLDCNGAGTVDMPRAGTFGAVTAATQILVGNLDIRLNTIASISGNINLTPDNPADDIILNGHWSFDGKTLVAISDSDTTFTAYAGKNIAIEGVTFDGGVVASITDLTVDNININGDAIVATSTLDLGSSSGTGFTRIVDENGDPVLTYDNANDKFTFSENITVSKGYTGSVTTVNAASYDLLVTDYILSVYYTLTGACAISLPAAQALVGRIIHVKDRYGNASVNNITITPAGGRLIDGAASFVITVDYNSVSIYSDGTNWYKF